MIEQAIIIRAIALTIFWEAAGEPPEGRLAVASVIWNRAGGDFAACKGVCEKPGAFSCWGRKNMRVPNDGPSRKAWRECRGIAERMADGKFVPTTEATHYHYVGTTPYWAAGMKHLKTIGRHKFYKEVTK
jgi:N-acetylmuramoyl-L-alanine amidase